MRSFYILAALAAVSIPAVQTVDERINSLESRFKVLASRLAQLEADSPGALVYRDLGMTLQINKWIPDESMLLLKDGSGWMVHPESIGPLEKAALGDRVSIFRHGDGDYPYIFLYKPESESPITFPARYIGGGSKSAR